MSGCKGRQQLQVGTSRPKLMPRAKVDACGHKLQAGTKGANGCRGHE